MVRRLKPCRIIARLAHRAIKLKHISSFSSLRTCSCDSTFHPFSLHQRLKRKKKRCEIKIKTPTKGWRWRRRCSQGGGDGDVRIIYVFVFLSHNFIINVYHRYCFSNEPHTISHLIRKKQQTRPVHCSSLAHTHLAARWNLSEKTSPLCCSLVCINLGQKLVLMRS